MMQHGGRNTQWVGLGGFVCCRVGDEQYAIRGAHVRNVARADRMVPGADGSGRLGTLRDGTAAVPVYSLAALFDCGPAFPPSGGHIVVTGDEGDAFGLMVDRITRVAAGKQKDVWPVPAFAGAQAASWFEGLLNLEEGACLVLAPSGLNPRHPDTERQPAAARVRRRAIVRNTDACDLVVTFASAALPDAGTRRLALSGRLVAALVQSLPVIPLPGRSPHVKAVAWWQKAAVPVLEFGGAPRRAVLEEGTRYLIARCSGRYAGAFVAFRVGADVALHRATSEDVQVAGRDGLPFLHGVFNVTGECVGLLDLDALAGGMAAPSTTAAAAGVPALT